SDTIVCHDIVLFFFFQAEDGIRDRNVTGVQTCALPILYRPVNELNIFANYLFTGDIMKCVTLENMLTPRVAGNTDRAGRMAISKIGRASCRERGELLVVTGVTI